MTGTLADFGIPAEQFRPAYPLPVDEDGNPRCIVISRCQSYDEVKEVLERQPRAPDGSYKQNLWIGNEDGMIVIGRER